MFFPIEGSQVSVFLYLRSLRNYSVVQNLWIASSFGVLLINAMYCLMDTLGLSSAIAQHIDPLTYFFICLLLTPVWMILSMWVPPFPPKRILSMAAVLSYFAVIWTFVHVLGEY